MSIISNNLCYLREEKGVTQLQLSKDIGITRTRIATYEESRCNPNIEALIAFSNYYTVSIDKMVRVKLELEPRVIEDMTQTV